MAELSINKSGRVTISDDVIGVIGSIAASEISGVYSLSGSFTEEVMDKFGKKSFKKGVNVETVENTISVDLNVIVDYGVKLMDVADEIQKSVKNAIESMTGMDVIAVNIEFDGLKVTKD